MVFENKATGTNFFIRNERAKETARKEDRMYFSIL